MKRLIPYLRVSTQKQGESRLGLEAQLLAVNQYAASVKGEVLASYEEIETGKKSDRPQLQTALAHAKRSKAVLVVAKLDRLARNVAFLSALLESGVEFVCCDNPHATKLTIHILAAVAEHEAEMISKRTKEALAAYKANGGIPRRLREEYGGNVPEEIAAQVRGKLGAARTQCRLTKEQLREGRRLGTEARARKIQEAYKDLFPVIKEMRINGANYTKIAMALNRKGHTTRKGKPWTGLSIKRVMKHARKVVLA